MKRLRGFKVGKKMKTAFRWIVRSKSRLSQPSIPNLVSKLTRFLSKAAEYLRCPNPKPNSIQLGRVRKPQKVEVPKGYLAVYVGESDGNTRREVLPVVYFNHPLFGELLKEVERVYGYEHEGGITIPCEYSQFEKVKMRIASWDSARR